ncbi:MAG: TusE/DsrC/DsvC family sulfur relay protein [Thiohalomonadales bacterium]
MAELLEKGQKLILRPDGSLRHMADWSIEVAEELAKREGLQLSEQHWFILNIMRDYYRHYNISPVRKLLLKEIREKLGNDKATEGYLSKLFPRDVLRQGIRIAGLPTPLLDVELEPVQHIQAAPTEKKHFVDEFEFEGRGIRVYANGNIVDLSQWNESMAHVLAQKEGIVLSSEHFEVIEFIRNFYFKYGIVPMVKLLRKHMLQQLGQEKSSREYLYGLFPGGPARQGSRIAGLPEPQGCIDQ